MTVDPLRTRKAKAELERPPTARQELEMRALAEGELRD